MELKLHQSPRLQQKKKVGEDSVFVNKDLEELKNIDFNFDIITFWHVLEHLNEPKKIGNLLSILLKKNELETISDAEPEQDREFIKRTASSS